MSPSRASRSAPTKRVPYKPKRDRRELFVAIGVAVLIVVVTATLVWVLRPNKESSADSAPVVTAPTTLPTDSTTVPTDSTTPTDSTVATDSTAPPAETTTPAP
jgi:cytoskeletal protein RodZ